MESQMIRNVVNIIQGSCLQELFNLKSIRVIKMIYKESLKFDR